MLNYCYPKNHIYSVLNNCDLKSAITRVIDYFDPNKSENHKTKVLDNSSSYVWTEQQIKLYAVDKTKNLTGTILEKRFDIILYEPPRNKMFYQDAINNSKTFKKILNKNGVLIVKINDFKEGNNNELKGSFEMWNVFCNSGFYLYDNIIYAYNNFNSNHKVTNRSEIIHMYFMIFKLV